MPKATLKFTDFCRTSLPECLRSLRTWMWSQKARHRVCPDGWGQTEGLAADSRCNSHMCHEYSPLGNPCEHWMTTKGKLDLYNPEIILIISRCFHSCQILQRITIDTQVFINITKALQIRWFMGWCSKYFPPLWHNATWPCWYYPYHYKMWCW